MTFSEDRSSDSSAGPVGDASLTNLRGLPYRARIRSASLPWAGEHFERTELDSIDRNGNRFRRQIAHNARTFRSDVLQKCCELRMRGAKRASSSLLAKRMAQFDSASSTFSEVICLVR